jgi:hypothetical protein
MKVQIIEDFKKWQEKNLSFWEFLKEEYSIFIQKNQITFEEIETLTVKAEANLEHSDARDCTYAYFNIEEAFFTLQDKRILDVSSEYFEGILELFEEDLQGTMT